MIGSYEVAIEGNETVETKPTLFEACNAVRGVAGGLVLEGGRLVAFWSPWHVSVRPGFGIHPHERAELGTYLFVTQG